MTWSQEFTVNASPYTFYPSLSTAAWTDQNASVEPVAELDQLINQVVNRLNEEGKKINSGYVATLDSIRTSIPGSYAEMTYQDRFNAVVNYGRQSLTATRDATVTNADLSSFYKQFYFYAPTSTQLQDLEAHFKSDDYGFGDSTKVNLKTSALNRSIQYGLVPAGTTVAQYETFTSPVNKAAFVQRLQTLNGSGTNVIIDPEKLEANPYEAAYAFMQLRESGKLTQTSTGTYSWSSGGSWKDLASFNNGGLLDTYQTLLINYEKSGVANNGVSLSQYIAETNRETYKQIEAEIASKKEAVDFSKISVDNAKGIIDTAVKQSLEESVNNLNEANADKELKIAALRGDAFREAQAALSRQKRLESLTKDDTFESMNDMFQSMGRDLGLKDGFLKSPSLRSNINFNWQNWFESELKARYDPNNPRNQLGNVIGRTEADARLGTQFIQDFLQRRFDGSKSLSEFAEYVDASDINPVLEKQSDTAFQDLAAKDYELLIGNINNPSTLLGNFWTNLQTIWAKGRDFDSSFYLNQSLGEINGSSMTVNQLHSNIKAIHNIAVEKGTTNLSTNDIKALDLVNVDKTSTTALNQQIELYRAWFNKAYAAGADLLNEQEFAKLHFDAYTKNIADPALGLAADVKLTMNDTDIFGGDVAKRIADQISYLTNQADEYLNQIQFGTFKTPEEHLMEMIQKSGIGDSANGGLFADAGLSDVVKQYIEQFSGVISTLAGESIRKQIRMVIDTGKTPDQKELGIEYIQRTKDQALSTIRSIISKESFSDQIIIDNAPGAKLNQSMSSWFSSLGLELLPGSAWTEFKKVNEIPADMTYSQWEKENGNKIDPNSGKPYQKVFWDYWATENNMRIVETKDPNSPLNTRVSFVVDQPSQSWVSWAKRISQTRPDDPILEGAQISVRSDAFDVDWYSKTNPFTKIKDEWNRIVLSSTQSILNTGGKQLGVWARDNGLNAEEAWKAYRTEQQKTNKNFGKDPTGNNVSFVTWSQNASQAEKDKFWQDSTPFWFTYLSDLGVVKGGTAKEPKYKTWSEWATEKGVSLERLGTDSKAMPPREFMEIHYFALGGSKKVNDEYLRTYFPEFDRLEAQGIVGKVGTENSPFDLSAFGFRDDMQMEMEPITKANRTTLSPIDFAMKDMFGDSMDADSFDFGANEQKPLNDFGLKIDMSYNKTMSQKKDFMNFDFGFGDFGGSGFGF